MSSTISANIQIWRQKAREGTLTIEETREAIAAIRAERLACAKASPAGKSKKPEFVDSEALLKELL